jgi:molybdenum-dependent DNA-binding transcriptional regulator ModE
LTRAQALENRAFLKLLRRTGNVRLACRELGLKYGTMQDRRRKHPAFAHAWDAALVFAQARIRSGAQALNKSRPSARAAVDSRFRGNDEGRSFRTAGGEMVMVRLKNGALQMRRAQPGKLTREAEQAFLAALSATCNVSLAAAAVGASEAAFHRRRRKDPAFAREVRMALSQGYDQLEMALLEAGMPGSREHDDWRSNEPPAMPPMTASQALQLMYLHQKEARLIAEPPHIRRRPRESEEAHSARLSAMYEEQIRRDREAFEVAEALRSERGEPAWGPAGEAVRMELGLGPRFRGDDEAGSGLPDLAQVTGWSTADPAKAPHHEGVALFGGWRLEDMEAKERGLGARRLRG